MRFLWITLLLLWSLPSQAEVYLEPQAFVKQQFAGNPPQAKVIWLNKTLKSKLADILNHEYAGLRVRYWQGGQGGQETVWVLNEIGKEKPITVGISIQAGRIKQLQVLVFRESRGWEVKHDFFTRQFLSLFLQNDMQLSGHVDSITGATLSVRAVKKLAKVALVLHAVVQP